MEVRFRNSYPSKVWVAVMYYDPGDCGQYGNWETKGWWGINTGQTKHPFNTNNRYAAFYAEAEDGAVWTGPYGPVYVYQQAFESCINIGSTGALDVVGMRLIDTHNANLTINLIP
jgi:hypothetical protein